MNTDQAKKLRQAIVEISASMTRIEGERDYIKESIDAMKDETELSSGEIRKLAKLYHDQSRDEAEAEHTEVMDAYDAVFLQVEKEA